MIIHTNPLFTAYFGASSDGLSADQYRTIRAHRAIPGEPFAKVTKMLHAESILFLYQVHGADGSVITPESKPLVSFDHDGDFLVTNTKVVLGLLTGDCMPVVMHDAFHNVVAVVHAGWRGSVQSILEKSITAMHEAFGTKPEHLKILFGPSAKVCCYKVSDDFIEQLKAFPFAESVIIKHGGESYFDLPGFNRLQLEALGIKKDAISMQYSLCTICHTTFNSYRRQGDQAGRQITAVCLK